MPGGNGNGYQYDRERVVTHDLAVVLKEFIRQYEAERPPEENPYRRRCETYMGAIQWIAQETGLSERRLSGMMAGETLTTSYWLADLILTKIGWKHRMDDIRELPWETSKLAVKSLRVGGLGGALKRFKDQEEWLEYLDQIGCRR